MSCGILSLLTKLTRPPTATVASNGIRPNGVIETLAVFGGAGGGAGFGTGDGDAIGARTGAGAATGDGTALPDPQAPTITTHASAYARGNGISRMVMPAPSRRLRIEGTGTRGRTVRIACRSGELGYATFRWLTTR